MWGRLLNGVRVLLALASRHSLGARPSTCVIVDTCPSLRRLGSLRLRLAKGPSCRVLEEVSGPLATTVQATIQGACLDEAGLLASPPKAIKQRRNAFIRFHSFSLSNSGLQTSHITRLDSKWRLFPVFEFRPRSQRSAKGGEWKTTQSGSGEAGRPALLSFETD